MRVRKSFASPTADEQERKRATRRDRQEEEEREALAKDARKEDEISNKARLSSWRVIERELQLVVLAEEKKRQGKGVSGPRKSISREASKPGEPPFAWRVFFSHSFLLFFLFFFFSSACSLLARLPLSPPFSCPASRQDASHGFGHGRFGADSTFLRPSDIVAEQEQEKNRSQLR